MCWYDGEMKTEDGQVVQRALECPIEGLRNKSRPRTTWMRQVEEMSTVACVSWEDSLCRTGCCWR